MLRARTRAWILVGLLPLNLLLSCGPNVQEYSITATVVRHMDNLTGEVVTETQARIYDPIADFEGICDKVLEVRHDKDVVDERVRVGDQLPLLIDGNHWTAEYRFERGGKYLGKVVGHGEIQQRRVSGQYQRFAVNEEGVEVLRWEVRFETNE